MFNRSQNIFICFFRNRRKNLTTETDLEDEYEDRSKSPMYDELSLPFIDQSLPPTPKVGRVVNGLDILLGHSVSENSLVGESQSSNMIMRGRLLPHYLILLFRQEKSSPVVKNNYSDLSEKTQHRDITNSINEDCQPNKKLDFL